MDELKTLLKRIFFPKDYTCTFCGREIFSEKTVCEDCDRALPRNDLYICYKCGRKTPYPTATCNDCVGKAQAFNLARSAYIYEKPISYAIQGLKYGNRRFLADEFAAEMEKVYLKTFYPCEAIVCVPTSKSNIAERGYNQSELIAAALSKRLDIPLIADAVVKTKDTESQVGLTQKERLINLSGSFAVKRRKETDGKALLLIDDVLTTGTTANLVAEKLKAAGATAVFVLTVASVYRGKN